MRKQSTSRVALFLHTLYNRCVNAKPVLISELISECGISANVGTIVRSKGIVEKVGKSESGYLYKWLVKPPNDELAQEISEELSSYYKKTAAASVKKQASAPKLVEVETTTAELKLPPLPFHQITEETRLMIEENNRMLKAICKDLKLQYD